MRYTLFNSGSHPERETRLVRQHLSSMPGGGAIPQIEKAQNDLMNFMSAQFENLINPNGVRNNINDRNMRNPQLWVEAFQNENIFTAPVSPNPLPPIFRPKDVLLTLPPEDRAIHFYRFARGMIPQGTLRDPFFTGVKAGLPGHHQEIFTAPDFEAYVNAQRRIRPIGIPEKNDLRTILDTIARMNGRPLPLEGDPTMTPIHRTSLDLARKAYKEVYPALQPGHLYHDYLDAVRQLQQLQPPPTNTDLRSHSYLVRQLRIFNRPSRFLGWLQTMTPAEAEAALKPHAAAREQQDAHRNLQKLGAQEALTKLSEGPRKAIEKKNRHFSQNFDGMEPWQQYATIGLGIYAMYYLWTAQDANKKSPKFLWLIPYNMIPPALIGTYLYLRLIHGDENAMDTMTGSTQEFLANIWNRGDAFLRGGGALPETLEAKDQRNLELMARYFDQAAFEKMSPAATAFATLAEARLGHIAESFRPNLDGRGGILYASPRDPLYLEVDAIIRRRSYNKNALHQLFHHHNPAIGKGLAPLFYQLAARKPKNRDIAGRIENARRASTTIGTGVNASYDNITDPFLRREYVRLINDGLLIAREEHRNEVFANVAASLLSEPEKPRKPDHAEHLLIPDSLGKKERELHALRTREVLPERKEVMELVIADAQEFFDHYSPPAANVIDVAAKARMMQRVREITALPATTVQQALTMAEQLKYAILVTAATREGAKLPITSVEVSKMLGEKPAYTEVITAVLNWINKELLTVSSKFGKITTISDLQAILAERFFTDAQSLEGEGFPVLQDKLADYKTRFEQLRDPVLMADRFFAQLRAHDLPAINRLGGLAQEKEIKDRFIQKILSTPEYQQNVNDKETYFAQRFGTSIVLAVFTTHRRNGIHALDPVKANRRITPTEENNLAEESEFLYREIVGTVDRPGDGMWAALTVDQTLRKFDVSTMNIARTHEQDIVRLNSINQTGQIATLHLAIQPLLHKTVRPAPVPFGVPLALPVVEFPIKDEVRSIAIKLWEYFRSLDPNPDVARELVRNTEWFQNLDILIDTMRLLNIYIDTPDAQIYRRIYAMRHGGGPAGGAGGPAGGAGGPAGGMGGPAGGAGGPAGGMGGPAGGAGGPGAGAGGPAGGAGGPGAGAGGPAGGAGGPGGGAGGPAGGAGGPAGGAGGPAGGMGGPGGGMGGPVI